MVFCMKIKNDNIKHNFMQFMLEYLAGKPTYLQNWVYIYQMLQKHNTKIKLSYKTLQWIIKSYTLNTNVPSPLPVDHSQNLGNEVWKTHAYKYNLILSSNIQCGLTHTADRIGVGLYLCWHVRRHNESAIAKTRLEKLRNPNIPRK